MEMCPACGKINNMIVSSSIRTVGKKRIITISYHCEQCGMFVRSEDIEEAAGK